MRGIIGLFAKSPFGPITEHGQKVEACVRMIPDLFKSLEKGDYDGVVAASETLSNLEHQADLIKNEIRNHLPRSILLPVDRADLLRLLKEQDGIADAAEDVAVLLSMRRLPVPEGIHELLFAMVEKVMEACSLTFEVINQLESLVAASFGGDAAQRVLGMVEEVGVKEWEADRAQMAVSKAIFAREKDLDPVSIVMWTRVLVQLGWLADHAENTCDHVRMMISKK